jgi:hypothetical protein
MQTKTQIKLLEHQFMMAREGGQCRIAMALLSMMSDQNKNVPFLTTKKKLARKWVLCAILPGSQLSYS